MRSISKVFPVKCFNVVWENTSNFCLPLVELGNGEVKDSSEVAGGSGGGASGGGGGGNQLVWMLRVQLAEALNLQDRNLVAKLYETMRCLETFDANGCRELVRALKEDYKVSQLELD